MYKPNRKSSKLHVCMLYLSKAKKKQRIISLYLKLAVIYIRLEKSEINPFRNKYMTNLKCCELKISFFLTNCLS